MLMGYARVSTDDQDTALQRDALAKAGAERIFEETRSGGTTERRIELARMIEQLRPGDVVLVYKIDRLARSLSDLLTIMGRIEKAGAAFRSLTEPVDTGSLAGRMLVQLLGAFAEFERGIIRERCMAGQQAAKARGVRLGRPKALPAIEEARMVAAWRRGDRSATQVAKAWGVSAATLKRAVHRAGIDPYDRRA